MKKRIALLIMVSLVLICCCSCSKSELIYSGVLEQVEFDNDRTILHFEDSTKIRVRSGRVFTPGRFYYIYKNWCSTTIETKKKK